MIFLEEIIYAYREESTFRAQKIGSKIKIHPDLPTFPPKVWPNPFLLLA